MNKDKMELDEAIKILKSMQSYMEKDEDELQAIETVLKALEKLQNHCKEMIKEKQELTSVLLDSIPKEKIEDKIGKTKEDIERFTNERNKRRYYEFLGTRNIKS